MLWARLALTLASLAACCFAPGFALVRRLRWRPLEKLCGAVAASLILIYLFAWAVFCFAPGAETGAFRAAGCVAAALAIWQWREIRRLARSFGARQALLGFGFLLLWSAPALAMIRNFSGAGWRGDWIEHFQRSLFFLNHLPARVDITGGYLLPARPPMMNVAAAFFMGQTGERYEVFQLVFTFLNLLAFFPCCLMLRALVRSRRSRYLPLTALFALNPMMMENSWYPWTKLLAVFFILSALALYLAGVRKGSGLRIAASFVCLAAGLLVHYSAGPYVAFLAGHYLFRVWRSRPNRMRELLATGIVCGLLLATWFAWSLRTYGARDTFESNTSVSSARQYEGGTAGKIAGNMLATLVPAILHDPESLTMFNQPNRWGELRDNAFVVYQTNLIFGMGLAGGPFVLWLLWQRFRRGRPSPERSFWLAFLPFVTVVGIAVVGERDLMGLAHLTLMPLEALGLTLLAASFPWKFSEAGRRTAALILLAGCVIDFSFGIFLQVSVESFDNSAQHTYFEGMKLEDNRVVTGAPGPETLSQAAWLNWFWKNRGSLQPQWIAFLGSLPQTPSLQDLSKRMRADEAKTEADFGGWYGRHRGRITFLGDHLSGAAPAILFLLLFLALMWVFGSAALRRAPALSVQVPVRKKAPARRRPPRVLR